MPNVTGFFVGGGRGRRGPPTLYFFAPPLSTMRDGRIAASRVFIKGRHAMLLMSWHCCSGPSHLLQRSARNLGTDRATVQLWGWRKGEAAERKERAARVGLWRSPSLRRSLPRSSHRAAKAAAHKKHVRLGPSLRYVAPRIGSAK